MPARDYTVWSYARRKIAWSELIDEFVQCQRQIQKAVKDGQNNENSHGFIRLQKQSALFPFSSNKQEYLDFQSSGILLLYDKSFIGQASSVKMAGYWPRSFLAFLRTGTKQLQNPLVLMQLAFASQRWLPFLLLSKSERRFKNTGNSENQTSFIFDIHTWGEQSSLEHHKSQVLNKESYPFRRAKVFG